MQALILAGGKGTRLRPLTLNTPKPVVPIGNVPFLVQQIDLLKTIGITEILLSLSYQPSGIKNVLGDGSQFGVELTYIVEPEPMGTAGAYKFAEKFLNTTTIVLNGDILTDIDLKKLTDQHQRLDAIATLTLVRVEDPLAYGLIQINDQQEIIRFLEKPKQEDVDRLGINTINAGIYILEPHVLKHISEGENSSFEYDVFPDLLKSQEKFCGYVSEGEYWMDIGTHDRYLQAHYDLMAGKVKNLSKNNRHGCRVSESAEIDSVSRLASGVVIQPGAVINNSVLGENVVVCENTVVENSVIWAGVEIDSGAKIFRSIIGFDCDIGKNVLVEAGSILGDRSVLGDSDRNVN